MLFLSVLTTIAAVGTANAATGAWASSEDGKLKFSCAQTPVLNAPNPGVPSSWKFTISEKTGRKQVVKGFGAAVTDGTVQVFNQLPPALRAQIMTDIMTPSGLNFNLIRHTVASSDLTQDPAYSYADNGNKPDPALTSFSLGDRGNAMLRLLAEMRQLHPGMTLLGSPWSPPGWMKQNGLIVGGNLAGNKLDHRYEDAYAQYFVKYLQAYQRGGVHVDAITIQNEPLNSKDDMPTLLIQQDEAAALIRDKIGPALRNSGLNTPIWAWDHNQDLPQYPQTVINAASAFVPATAWHCYAGNDPKNWAVLTAFHNQNPNKEQYMTECWHSKKYTDWLHASNFNLMPLQNWANGIIAWNLGSWTNGGPSLTGSGNCGVCTGLVTVSPDGRSYTKEIEWYMMGQFSRYIPKGAVVVDGTGTYLYPDNSGMMSVATINPDGTRTVVIQNRFKNDVWVSVGTQSESQTWNAKVPARSVTTWVLPKAA